MTGETALLRNWPLNSLATVKDFTWRVLLAVLFTTSLFFRLNQIDRIPGINGDEAYAAVQVQKLLNNEKTQLITPTGRPISPLYLSYLSSLKVVFPANTFFNLRFTACLTGLLTILICFYCLQKIGSGHFALYTTLLFSATPMAIAYSRSAVEQSWMAFFSFWLVLFFWKKNLKAAALVYISATLMHPVHLFLFPFVLICFLRGSRSLKNWGLIILSLTCSLFLIYTLPKTYTSENMDHVLRFLLTEPLSFLSAFIYSVKLFVSLVSGSTIYTYFVTPPEKNWDLPFTYFLLVIFSVGLIQLFKNKKTEALWFLLASSLSFVAFFFAGGPRAFSAGLSRYTFFLIPLFCIALTLCLEACLARTKTSVIISLLCFLFLFSFNKSYFQPFNEANTTFSLPIYASSHEEPKQFFFKRIQKITPKNQTLVVEDWWLYWPMEYLNQREKKFNIVMASQPLGNGGLFLGYKNGAFESEPAIQKLNSEKYSNLILWKNFEH